MIYQIVSPIVTPIYGDSFKEAIKNYVKFNHNLNINNLIIKDQSQHWEARLRYYKENQKNIRIILSNFLKETKKGKNI